MYTIKRCMYARVNVLALVDPKVGVPLELIFNPFDTEPMAKIAVKMSIMRVVKFMSSPGNVFTS